MQLDIKTLILVNLIINLLNAFTMTLLWRQYRKRFAGLSFWLVQMVFQVLGTVSILFRGVIPSLVSIISANFFLISGIIALLMGLEHFVGKKGRHYHNYALLAVYMAIITFFSAVKPNLAFREIAFSAMVVIINAQICWLAFRKGASEYKYGIRLVGFILFGHTAVSFLRLVLLIAHPLTTADFFRTGFIDATAYALYFSLNAGLMIALVLAVTSRLLIDVKAQEEKFSKAFKSAPYAVMLTRLSDGTIFEVNDSFVESTGYGYEEALGKTTRDLNLWIDDCDRSAMVDQIAGGLKISEKEFHFRRKSGDALIALFSAEVLDINGEACILASIHDVTEQSLLKKKLEELATHDVLTGLPNRRLLEDRFFLMTANARRAKKQAAVLSLDLDRFKTINDTYGHAVGDSVLVEAALRLRAVLRKVDTVARIGGDEFVVLLGDIDRDETALEVANKILHEFRRPFMFDGHTFTLSVSIGIALFPGDGVILEDLLRRSDKALYSVKEHGRDGCRIA